MPSIDKPSLWTIKGMIDIKLFDVSSAKPWLIWDSIEMEQPQAACVAVSKSLQNEWTYMQQVVPDCEEIFSL